MFRVRVTPTLQFWTRSRGLKGIATSVRIIPALNRAVPGKHPFYRSNRVMESTPAEKALVCACIRPTSLLDASRGRMVSQEMEVPSDNRQIQQRPFNAILRPFGLFIRADPPAERWQSG